ncbi:MAG: S41 family peptidase, partial [Thermoleophilia bacterium]
LMRRRRRSFLPLLVLLTPLLIAAGIWLGGHPDTLPEPIRNALVEDTDGRVYEEAVDTLERDYYREVDRKKLLDQSLEQAVGSLDDRFSHYFAPRDYDDFQEATEGRFEGVGMTVEEVRRGLSVITVYEGSPADRGGLEPGDVITHVDGRSIAGSSSEQSTTKIKGPAGTSVKLTVRSDGRTRQETLKRAEVEIPVVRAEMRREDGRKIAHVRLSGFTSGAHGEVGAAVRRLLKEGAEGVVLDLRDNGGGLLNEAVMVSSVFIPDGKIVSTKGRSRPAQVYEATGNAIDTDIPVVVLVNDRSASASEIVTGALQDRDRATVVGTRTFGKGVFQEIEPLSNGGALDITVGEYFLPSGRNLGGEGVSRGAGVAPDVRAADNPDTPGRDEALIAALREAA